MALWLEVAGIEIVMIICTLAAAAILVYVVGSLLLSWLRGPVPRVVGHTAQYAQGSAGMPQRSKAWAGPNGRTASTPENGANGPADAAMRSAAGPPGAPS